MRGFWRYLLLVFVCLALVYSVLFLAMTEKTAGVPAVFFGGNGTLVEEGETFLLKREAFGEIGEYRYQCIYPGSRDYEVRVMYNDYGCLMTYERITISIDGNLIDTNDCIGTVRIFPGAIYEVTTKGLRTDGVEDVLTFYIDSTAL